MAKRTVLSSLVRLDRPAYVSRFPLFFSPLPDAFGVVPFLLNSAYACIGYVLSVWCYWLVWRSQPSVVPPGWVRSALLLPF